MFKEGKLRAHYRRLPYSPPPHNRALIEVWPQSTHRVAMATFCRTLPYDGKIIQGKWGWEVHALPFHSNYTITSKVVVYSQAETEDTLPIFLLVSQLWLCTRSLWISHIWGKFYFFFITVEVTHLCSRGIQFCCPEASLPCCPVL